MQGIKKVAAILQCFAAPALFPVVEPDGDETQHRKALSGEFEHLVAQGEGNKLPLKEDDVQQDHANELSQPSQGKSPEDIEQQDGEKTGEAVVHESQYRQNAAGRQPQQASAQSLFRPLLSQQLQSIYSPQTQQQREHDVLVEGEDRGTHHHQVEGNLRDECGDEQPLLIALSVGGVEISFHQLKGKMG